MKVIALSGKMGSGKDTIANIIDEILREYGKKTQKIAFADELKNEVDSIINSIQNKNTNEFLISLSPEDLSYIKSLVNNLEKGYSFKTHKKNEYSRKLLQFWGTDIRRKQNNNYWIEKLNDKIKEASSNNMISIVTDVRFPNEAKSIKNGVLFYINVSDEVRLKRLIKRDNVLPNSDCFKHKSEPEIKDFEDIDLIINNNETINENFKTTLTVLLKERSFI